MSVAEWTLIWAKEKQISVHYLQNVDSTNNWAKHKEHCPSHKLEIFIAEMQSKGRGRNQSEWISTQNQLLSSWSYPLAFAPQPLLSPLIGNALFQALKTVWPALPWGLKIPNDIYLDTKKVAGLLIENIQQGGTNQMIIGLGLNVGQAPAEVEQAGCIEHYLNRLVTQNEWQLFLYAFYKNLNELLANKSHPELTASLSEQLLGALNQRQGLTEKFTKVFPDASLLQGENRVYWNPF